METTVKPLPGSQLQLTISLGPEEVNSFFDKVYKRLSQSGRIRGFRPGKAPRTIIRHVFGEDQIRASAYVEILEEVLPKALENLGRQVLGDPALPSLEEVELAEDKGVTLPITVSVYPEAHVADFGETKILRPRIEVTEQEVQQVLDELRQERATWQEISRAIAPGDRVTVDVAFYQGEDVTSTREGMQIEVVAHEEGAEPTVASKLAGHFVGQTVVVETGTGEKTDAEGTALSRVEATIRKVEEKVLPDLDDDFARSLGDYENLDSLKEDIRSQLRAQKERRAKERMESQAVAYLLAATDVELPEILVEHLAAARLENLEDDLRKIGSSLQELAEAGALDLEEVEDSERKRAVVALETKLAFEALAKRENLEPEEQDIEAEIEELARRTRNDVDFVRQAYELQDEVREQIESRARISRCLRWIVDKAVIEEVSEEEFEERYRQLLEELEQRRRQRRAAQAEQAGLETGQGEANAAAPAERDATSEETEEPAPTSSPIAPVHEAGEQPTNTKLCCGEPYDASGNVAHSPEQAEAPNNPPCDASGAAGEAAAGLVNSDN